MRLVPGAEALEGLVLGFAFAVKGVQMIEDKGEAGGEGGGGRMGLGVWLLGLGRCGG